MVGGKRLNLSLEGQLNQVIEKSRIRLLFILSLVLITFIAIAAKTVKLTFFLENEQSNISYRKNSIIESGYRIDITDRTGITIASSLETSSLVANPKKMIEKDEAAKKLSKYIDKYSRKELAEIFNSEKSFVWLKRKLHPDEQYKINSLGIPGLYFEKEEKRVYPHGKLFSQNIGMVGIDNEGLTGFEKYIDDLSEKEQFFLKAEKEIKTSFDLRVQNIVREELLKQVRKHKAKRASSIVLDVNSGEVLALVSLPDYDPNNPSDIERSSLFNVSTLGNYEMGSTFKPLTFAIALEEKKINMWSLIDASKPIEISRFTISDFHAKNRVLSMPEVLMYSSNIGTAKVADKVGADGIQEYFRKLGLYSKLDIEIAEKSKPIMPRKWREVTTLTASYGHGIAVSPLHIASAFSATINGGYFIKPTILKRKEEEKIEKTRVFSKKTSDNMRKLLRLVVSKGSGERGGAEGYFVGGKTGTAEKLTAQGTYSKNKLVSSFIAAFPMNAPQYTILVMLDEPQATTDTWGYATGGWVSAPAVAKIISRIAPILKVKPVNENDPKIKKKFSVNYKVR